MSPVRVKSFHISILSRVALMSTHTPIHQVPGTLLLGVKQQVHEADHYLQSVPWSRKGGGIYTSTLPYACVVYCLVKHRGALFFYFLLLSTQDPCQEVLANMVLGEKHWSITILIDKSGRNPQHRSLIPSSITTMLTSYC